MTETNETTTTTTTAHESAGRPRSIRVGTVIWGFILLGIAALFFTFAQLDLSGINPGVVAAWVVIGIGALAILGGLVGAAVRRR